MERNRKPPQYSPVDFKPKNRINVLSNNPLPNNHIAPNRNIQSSYQNKNRSRSMSISSRQSNNSDEEVLDDGDSSDETNSLSSNASSINETNNQKTDFLLLITDNIQKPYSNLTSYVEKEKMSIHQMFNKDFLTGLNKIQYQDEKNRKRQFEKKSEPYEQEQTLIYKNISSFLKEMQRLSKNPIQNSYLRNAYDREFRRARAKLPFYAFRHTILEELEKNDMLIIIGHTGSGKTTQVPQYLLEAGFAKNRKIVCTQPRKIASISVCKRIAFELDCEHTNLVDFKTVRTFLNKQELERKKKFNHKDNKLLLMTDRLLLQEYKKDNLLRKYSCIIIDEAHERTLFTDILLCELKKLVPKRRQMKNPLKLIIMSATIDETKISNYLNSCKVITIPGQLYPVKVFYEKIEQDYVSQSIRKIKHLIESNKLTGHALVFLASLDDLKKAQNKLKVDNDKYSVMILHGNMNMEEQSKVFEELDSKIKIIFTTNVAETSITINGVKVIIDSGRVKQKVYDQDRNISILKLKFINQSSAQQRKGRAGRMQSGECYRLYELKDLENMEFSCEPEILRMHLGIVCLELLSFGVDNIIEYDLIDKPDRNDIIKSIKKLESLGFVEYGKITENGRIAADLGLEPMISRMIIEGINLGIGIDMIKIAAMLTITNILYKKDLTKDEKNQAKVQNSNTKGDLFTLLSIYNQFSQNKFKTQYSWCNANRYYCNALRFAKQTYGELYNIIKTRLNKNIIFDQSKKEDLILKAICSGLHLQLAYFNGVVNRQNVYKLYELNQEVFIHNESVLNVLGNSDIDSIVLYTELNQHDRLYIKNLTPVSHELLSQYSRIDLDKLKKESKKELLINNINIQVIEKIKGNNSEMQQQIEELIGSALIVNKDSIKTYVSTHNFSNAKKILEEHIDKAKQMLKNELFEFKPKDCLKSIRVIFNCGLNVQTILFEKEFIRVNFKTSSGFSHDSLKRLFERNGRVILFNSNKISANKINGFVVFGNYKCAKQAYENLNGYVENNSILSLQPCFEIHDDEFKLTSRQKTITAYWYLTEPTGIAFLTFKNKSAGLELIKETLRNLNYLFRPEIIDQNQIKIHNVTQLDRYLDEVGFKNLFKRYLPDLENCSFIRKKEDNLGSIDVESLQMQTILIQSLFSKFGEIEDLTMKPFHVSKKGNIVVNFQIKLYRIMLM
ncbi:unnamed protein product [Brachionus calyciflorus]|uniref:Uncharacterized protein n=1 Tax=Brachionus calyciflorus TaxID=104777 RepID=A0A814H6E9_9BILA|nr:unnamed protein product [Brachionus calyciflorus]